jgi:hypothetical protein
MLCGPVEEDERKSRHDADSAGYSALARGRIPMRAHAASPIVNPAREAQFHYFDAFTLSGSPPLQKGWVLTLLR